MPTEPMPQTNASGEKERVQAIQLSWIDQLIAAITRLPGPSWLFYVTIFIVLVLVNNGLQWLDGTLPVGTFDSARTTDVIFPLYFLALMHYCLVEERDHKGAAVAERLTAILQKLHRNLDADHFEQMGGIQSALSALNLEREQLNKISTWPWESGTLRGFVTAIFIPILLWLLTRLLENFV